MTPSDSSPEENVEKAKKPHVQLADQDTISAILKRLGQLGRDEKVDAEEKREHRFWKTQPVPQSSESLEMVDEDGPIEADAPLEQIAKKADPLPAGFEWAEVDVTDATERKELYLLLNQNYVEDHDSLFRFDYPPMFLEWALKPPGWLKEWHVGVRVATSHKLVAFISAIPMAFRVRSQYLSPASSASLTMISSDLRAVEINFLCVHKKLRDKRLAPVLIREITRRVHLHGIFQAIYTAGIKIPEAIAVASYFHRQLNPQKLIDVGFVARDPTKTMADVEAKMSLPKEATLSGLRAMEERDVAAVCMLLGKNTDTLLFAPLFSEADVRHWLLPIPQVVTSYVVENQSGQITDFISFYSLPSSVMASPLHSSINVAYLFYYHASTQDRLFRLVQDALVLAKKEKFDVFNCLDIMDNQSFLRRLKFSEGDGQLHYYLFNWKTKAIESEKIGLVML